MESGGAGAAGSASAAPAAGFTDECVAAIERSRTLLWLIGASQRGGCAQRRPSARRSEAAAPCGLRGGPEYVALQLPWGLARDSQRVLPPHAVLRGAVAIRRLRDQYRDFAAESIAAMNAESNQISTAFGSFGGAERDDAPADSQPRDLTALFQPPVGLMFQGTYADVRGNVSRSAT